MFYHLTFKLSKKRDFRMTVTNISDFVLFVFPTQVHADAGGVITVVFLLRTDLVLFCCSNLSQGREECSKL